MAKKPFFFGLQMNDDTLWVKHAVAKLDVAAVTMLSWTEAWQTEGGHVGSRVDLLSITEEAFSTEETLSTEEAFSTEETFSTEEIFSTGSQASAGLPACSVQPAMHEATVQLERQSITMNKTVKWNWYHGTLRACQHEMNWDSVQSKAHSGMMVEQNLQGVKLWLTSGGSGDLAGWSAFLKGILPSNLAREPFFLGLQMAILDRHATKLQVATVQILSWAGA
jgi:hypothetical protein